MFLFWAALAPAGISAQDLPEPMSPRRLVNDFAGLLSDSQRQALERKLVDFDRETSTQIAVVTVDDLGDYAPSDFAQRLHDNGASVGKVRTTAFWYWSNRLFPVREARPIFRSDTVSKGSFPILRRDGYSTTK